MHNNFWDGMFVSIVINPLMLRNFFFSIFNVFFCWLLIRTSQLNIFWKKNENLFYFLRFFPTCAQSAHGHERVRVFVHMNVIDNAPKWPCTPQMGLRSLQDDPIWHKKAPDDLRSPNDDLRTSPDDLRMTSGRHQMTSKWPQMTSEELRRPPDDLSTS